MCPVFGSHFNYETSRPHYFALCPLALHSALLYCQAPAPFLSIFTDHFITSDKRIITYDYPKIIRDKKIIIYDHHCITSDKNIITCDQSIIINDKKFIRCDDRYISNDENIDNYDDRNSKIS